LHIGECLLLELIKGFIRDQSEFDEQGFHLYF
jgi:hypothetical protein